MFAAAMIALGLTAAAAPMMRDDSRLPPPPARTLLLSDIRATYHTVLPTPSFHASATTAEDANLASVIAPSAPVPGFDLPLIAGVLTGAARPERFAAGPSLAAELESPAWHSLRTGEAAVRLGLVDPVPARLRRRSPIDTMIVLRIDGRDSTPPFELRGGVVGAAWALLAER